MPFAEIPPEVIQRVFSLCCGRVVFKIPSPPGIRTGTTQETLSLVCSRWREIALNTRALWGDLVVVYEARDEEPAEPTSSFQFVQNWLNRAGITPISLSITVYGAFRDSQITAISQALLSSFHITDLGLVSSCCDHSKLLLPTTNSYYLKRLHLTVDDPESVNDTFPWFPEVPSLQELQLSLRLYELLDFPNIYLIPWHQLRVFTLCNGSNWPSQLMLNILQQCKSLVECTLSVNVLDEPLDHIVVLPNLASLVLCIYTTGSADHFIRSLTLPNLKSLDIRSSMYQPTTSLSSQAIITMAHQSGFNCLTNFSWFQITQPVDVMSLLGSMPALERVQFRGRLMFQPETFDNLSSGAIGPKLEEIYFSDMGEEEIALMIETVGQRHEKAKTMSDIRSFTSVTCCTSGSDFELHNQIQRAKQCGEAFNAHVEIITGVATRYHLTITEMLLMDEPDSDEEESGPNPV